MTNTTEFGPIVGYAFVGDGEAIEFATQAEATEYATFFGGFVAPIIATGFAA